MTWLFAAFLVAHGLVHIPVWRSATVAEGQGTHPDHSWILGDRHALVAWLSTVVAAMFVIAAIGVAFDAAWWVPATISASAASLLLVGLFPGALAGLWVLMPVAIDVVLITAAVRANVA